jgi:hypothetical protein
MFQISKHLTILLIAVFLVSLISLPLSTAKANSKTIVVPDDYPTIGAAIGNATNAEIILVRSGTYEESILSINKALSIIGENPDTTQIVLHPPSEPLFGSQAYIVYDNAIQINANQVVISGFEISTDGGAISFSGSDCEIIHNNLAIAIIGNGDKTQVVGNNFIVSSGEGIDITGSYQLITQNIIEGADTGCDGIACAGSFNLIINNTLSLNQVSYDSNLQQGCPINQGIQLSGSSNLLLNNTLSYGRINLAGDNNYIENNICNSISMSGSDNTFLGNYVHGSLGLVGSGNIFCGNCVQGLLLGNAYMDTPNNLFYQNNFDFSRGKIVRVWTGVLSSLILDNGSVGNYWTDYRTQYHSAKEIDDSGVGDTPYRTYLVYVNNSYEYVFGGMNNYTITLTDRYPLLSPFDISSIQIQLPSWASISVPSIPTPSFSPKSTSNTNATPTVPELSWLIILPFLFSVFFIAVIFRHRKPFRYSNL